MKLDPISKYALKEIKLRRKRFSKNLRHAAKHPADPEAIHDLRVSIRRNVQAFKTFRDLLDPAAVKHLRKRLHKVMDLCAAVRNCDVALTLLEEVGISQTPLLSRLKRKRSETAKELRRGLKKERAKRYALPDVRSHPKERDWRLNQGIEANLRSFFPPLAAEFFSSGRAAIATHASYQTLHRFRLQTKRFRYTLEMFESFYGSEMSQGANILKEFQDRLGDINDCATTIVVLGRNRRAVAALGKLLRQRRIVLEAYARTQFTSQKLDWWQRWLTQPARTAA